MKGLTSEDMGRLLSSLVLHKITCKDREREREIALISIL
jgi:hypothetical protein